MSTEPVQEGFWSSSIMIAAAAALILTVKCFNVMLKGTVHPKIKILYVFFI